MNKAPLLEQEGWPRLKGADGVVAHTKSFGMPFRTIVNHRPPRRFAPPLLYQEGKPSRLAKYVITPYQSFH